MNRKLVSPGALKVGKERFEAREDYTIVLQVLAQDEIREHAQVTKKIHGVDKFGARGLEESHYSIFYSNYETGLLSD